MGEITPDFVEVTAMSPEQRCTIASVAGHAMYERSNPYHEFVAGGSQIGNDRVSRDGGRDGAHLSCCSDSDNQGYAAKATRPHGPISLLS